MQTLGSIFSFFAFTLLIAKVAIAKNVSGISLKTLEAYVIVYIARLSSILVSGRTAAAAVSAVVCGRECWAGGG